MPVVIDASALVEVLLGSALAPAVTRAVGRSTMVAPDLVNAEVLSTLRRQVHQRELAPARADMAVASLMAAPVRRIPTLVLARQAWSLGHNVSSYDACYVALARRLGCGLVTADGRLGRAPGLDVPVVVVGEGSLSDLA